MTGEQLNGLLLLAALVSIQMSQNLSPDQLELLSNFFEVLGNNLALLALAEGDNE